MAPPQMRRYNGWLPSSPAVYNGFIDDILKRVKHPPPPHHNLRAGREFELDETNAAAKHTPSVEKFKKAIHANPTMLKLFDHIFLQASSPNSRIAALDPKNENWPKNKIHSLEKLCLLLDVIVVGPPKFAVMKDEGGEQVAEPVGVPIYLLFDLLSNTSAAYDLFRMEEFNKALKELLCSWGEYLKTDDSSKTLTNKPDGWFSDAAIDILESEKRGVFNETYVTPNPDAVNRGYDSWDAFFTRKIQSTARPVYPPLDQTFIYNACESTVERHQHDVQLHDQFWLKGMAYSLYDMFEGDKIAEKFVGGTVYQAFLSPQDYHRWHSPVVGTVVDARVVNGTYYAALPDGGEVEVDESYYTVMPEIGDDGSAGDPHGALIRSQPWLTVAATRAIITIQADNPKIGLVGFIGVGMAEVSTCDVTVQKGQRVQPGHEIGMFHFGGSSHALVFGPHVKLTFTDEVVPGNHIKVNRMIAGTNQ